MGSKLTSSCIPIQWIVGGQKSGLQESEISSPSEAGTGFACWARWIKNVREK